MKPEARTGLLFLVGIGVTTAALMSAAAVTVLTKGAAARIAAWAFFLVVALSGVVGTVVIWMAMRRVVRNPTAFPRTAKDWHRLAGVMLWMSIVPVALGVFFGIRTVLFLRTAQRTTGTIVDLLEHTGGNQGTTYTPLFTFTDAAGRTHRVVSRVSSYPPVGIVGDRVPVLYDPRDPSRAKIDRFLDVWGLCVLPAAFGVINLLVFGIVREVARRKMAAAGRGRAMASADAAGGAPGDIH